MPRKPASWLTRQVKQVKKDMDELPEWQKANRGFAKPKPARRPVSAAEWQRRWTDLRRYVIERRAFTCGVGSTERAAAYENVQYEMSRLTRPTPRRPKVKR